MIERIETAYYQLPTVGMGDAGHGRIDFQELVTVKLYADGLVGQGYAYTVGRGGRAIQALIDYDLAPLLIGREAGPVEQLWHLMWQHLLFVGRGGLSSFAIGAIDIALWDWRGLSQGQPLYAILGGTPRELPAYGSGVDLLKSENELLEQITGFMDKGFPGVKMKVGRPDFTEDEARVGVVRRLIGDRVDLMVDANMSWNMHNALERGRRLAVHDLFWLEEPVRPEDVAGHAVLVKELRMPVALGESLHSLDEFQNYIEVRAVEIVQVDPITNGGITVSIEVLRQADKAGLRTSSHYADELCAHLLCSSARPIYLEKHAFALDRYLEKPQQIVGGCVRPSEDPGTGHHFDEEVLSVYKA